MRYWVCNRPRASLYHADDCRHVKGRTDLSCRENWFGPHKTVAEAKAEAEAQARVRRDWRDGPCKICKPGGDSVGESYPAESGRSATVSAG